MGNGEGEDDRGTATGRPTASERATGGTAVMFRPPLARRPRGRDAFAEELDQAAAESRRAGDAAAAQYARSIPSRAEKPVQVTEPLGWDFGNTTLEGLEPPLELVMPARVSAAGLDIPELYRLVNVPKPEDPKATVAEAWKMAVVFAPPFHELPDTVPANEPLRLDPFPTQGSASLGSAMAQLRRLTVSGLEAQLRKAGLPADFTKDRGQPLAALVQGIAYCGPGIVGLFEANGKLWRNVFDRPAVSVDAVPCVKPGVYLHAAVPRRDGDRASAIDFYIRLDGGGVVAKGGFAIDTRPNTTFFKRSTAGGTVIVIAKSYWDRKGLRSWAKALPYRLWETVKDSIRFYLLAELKDRALALTDPRAVAQFVWGFVKSKIPGVRALNAVEDLSELARVMVMASRGTDGAETGDINVAARLLTPLVADEIVGQMVGGGVRGVAQLRAKASTAKPAASVDAKAPPPRATETAMKAKSETAASAHAARPQMPRVNEPRANEPSATEGRSRGVSSKEDIGATQAARGLTASPTKPAGAPAKKRAKPRTQGAVKDKDTDGGKFKLAKGNLWRLGVFGKPFGSRTRSQREHARRVEQTRSIEQVLTTLREKWGASAEGESGRIEERLKAGVDVKKAVRAGFDTVRSRFWRAVYEDPELREWLKQGGLHFLYDETGKVKDKARAPYLLYRKGDGSFVRITVDVDHVARLRDAPDAALDGTNLRLVPPRENRVVLEDIRRLDPFQSSDADGHPDARIVLDGDAATDIDRAIEAMNR